MALSHMRGILLIEPAREGDASAVRRLLAEGADLTASNEQNATALHIAAAYGQAHIIQVLLEAGASPALPGPSGMLALHFAAARNFPAATRLLLDAAPGTAAAVDSSGRSPLLLAAQNGAHATLPMLLEAAPHAALIKTFNKDLLPLMAAAAQGDAEAVRLLLAAAPLAASQTACWDNRVATPLHAACLGGHTAVVRQLLAAAPQAASTVMSEATPLSPLHVAITLGRLDCVRFILEAAPEAALVRTTHNFLPLHEVAASDLSCGAAIAQLLLAAAPGTETATINVQEDDGITPLHAAALQGNAAVAELLVHAAPQAVGMLAGSAQRTPLEIALAQAADAVALQAAPGNPQPAKPPSVYLNTARPMLKAVPSAVSLPLLLSRSDLALPLFPDLASHWPLTEALWQQVPAPCPGLGRALPAVLQRSQAEVALLVAHLPPADASRLRAFALALHHSQRQVGVFLPAELAGRI